MNQKIYIRDDMHTAEITQAGPIIHFEQASYPVGVVLITRGTDDGRNR